MGYAQQQPGLGFAFAIPGIVKTGSSILSSVSHLFGGHTQAEKDQERIRRGDELYQCALGGDVMAARVILGSSQNTHSSSAAGVAHYQQLWQQLQGAAPAIAQEAARQGPQLDNVGAGCYSITGPVPVPAGGVPVAVGAGGAPAVNQAGIVGGLSLGTLALAGGGLYLAAQLLQHGGRRRR